MEQTEPASDSHPEKGVGCDSANTCLSGGATGGSLATGNELLAGKGPELKWVRPYTQNRQRVINGGRLRQNALVG